MKVKKQELEQLTEQAAETGTLAMTLLLAMKCPIPEIYESVEKFLLINETVRKDLELEELISPKLLAGGLSSKIAKLRDKFGSPDERKIGFQVPESDTSKMN